MSRSLLQSRALSRCLRCPQSQSVVPRGSFLGVRHAKRSVFFTIVKEYEQAVILTLGKLTARSIKKGGLRVFIPAFQEMYLCDMRTRVHELSPQQLITSDNVSINVNAVLYYRVVDSKSAALKIDNVDEAIQQLGHTQLRNTLSAGKFQELLFNRDTYAHEMLERMTEQCKEWGVEIEYLQLKNIDMSSDEMIRAMAKEAEATRERTAAMIRADGELEAACKLKEAGDIMRQNGGQIAMELRTLQSIERMSKEEMQNTLVVSDEVLQNKDAFIAALLAHGSITAQKQGQNGGDAEDDNEDSESSLQNLLQRLNVV